MPRLGGRKLLHKVRERDLKYGRDKFFELLRENNLLVKRLRSYHQTTNSRHWLRKYPNLIKGIKSADVEQIWVSDITYLQTEEGFTYLSLITDSYSRKIVGYDLSESLKAEGAIRALKMAIKDRRTDNPTIHHSDRGLQYCSEEYQRLLKENSIISSMTENSDPYENALAERMNGILKTEFFLDIKFPSKELAEKAVKEVIEIYNTKRPHCSLKMKTPEEIHKKSLKKKVFFRL